MFADPALGVEVDDEKHVRAAAGASPATTGSVLRARAARAWHIGRIPQVRTGCYAV